LIIKSIWNAVKTFWDDNPFTHASSIAFYTIISLPAILILAINILSIANERIDVKRDLLHQLNTFLGPNTVDQATNILENAANSTRNSNPELIGLIILMFSATTVFISLQNGVNKIWGESPKNSNDSKLQFLLNRLLSLALILSFGFIFLVTLFMDSLLSLFENWLETNYSELFLIIAWFINFVLNLCITTLIFTVIFRILPSIRVPWFVAFVGGALTSTMFLLGKFLIGYYLSVADVGSVYGASGSLVIFLSWVYYSSVLILFGSKITFEYFKLNSLSNS